MKIAYFVDGFPVLSETFILNQINGMIDRGHEVDLYATAREHNEKVHADVFRHGLLARARFIDKPDSYLMRLTKATGLIARQGLRRWRHIAHSLNVIKYGSNVMGLGLLYSVVFFWKEEPKHYDIIHCQFGTLGRTALLLRRLGLMTGKVVTSIRGADLTRQNRPRYERHALFHEGDLFCPVSEYLKDMLIQKGCDEKKIIVHHSGINCSTFEFSERRRGPSEPTRIITIARLVEKKGVSYAIEAVGRMIEAGKNIQYTVVGDGILRPQLERLIKDLGMQSHIQLAGWKNHDEVIRLLQGAHVLVAPSVKAKSGDQEGIPNAVKEAMATGLPIIGTLHSGIPELVKDGVSGFLVPERDVSAIEERLSYFVDHPEVWPAMGRAGRARVEAEFDADKLNDELAALYQRLLMSETLRV